MAEGQQPPVVPDAATITMSRDDLTATIAAAVAQGTAQALAGQQLGPEAAALRLEPYQTAKLSEGMAKNYASVLATSDAAHKATAICDNPNLSAEDKVAGVRESINAGAPSPFLHSLAFSAARAPGRCPAYIMPITIAPSARRTYGCHRRHAPGPLPPPLRD